MKCNAVLNIAGRTLTCGMETASKHKHNVLYPWGDTDRNMVTRGVCVYWDGSDALVDDAPLRAYLYEAKVLQNPKLTEHSEVANTRQVGGDHYKRMAVEPWDVSVLNDLDFFQAEITYYVMRWKLKGGLEDLKKAQHWLQKYIEVETARRERGDAGMKALLLSDAADKAKRP